MEIHILAFVKECTKCVQNMFTIFPLLGDFLSKKRCLGLSNGEMSKSFNIC